MEHSEQFYSHLSKRKDQGLDKHGSGLPLLSLNCVCSFCKMFVSAEETAAIIKKGQK